MSRFDNAIEALQEAENNQDTIEELREELQRESKRTEIGQWMSRALGTYIACQHYGITAGPFPIGYSGYVFATLGGAGDELIAACKKFVDQMQKPLGVAHDKAEQEKIPNG